MGNDSEKGGEKSITHGVGRHWTTWLWGLSEQGSNFGVVHQETQVMQLNWVISNPTAIIKDGGEEKERRERARAQRKSAKEDGKLLLVVVAVVRVGIRQKGLLNIANSAPIDGIDNALSCHRFPDHAQQQQRQEQGEKRREKG